MQESTIAGTQESSIASTTGLVYQQTQLANSLNLYCPGISHPNVSHGVFHSFCPIHNRYEAVHKHCHNLPSSTKLKATLDKHRAKLNEHSSQWDAWSCTKREQLSYYYKSHRPSLWNMLCNQPATLVWKIKIPSGIWLQGLKTQALLWKVYKGVNMQMLPIAPTSFRNPTAYG